MKTAPTIAIFRTYPDPLMQALHRLGDVVMIDATDALAGNTKWHTVDAAFVATLDSLDSQAIAAAPRLRYISSIGAGLDHIDLQACADAGIMVRNTPMATVNATADHVFGLLLATARRISAGDAFVRRGDWGWGAQLPFGVDVSGRTIGIIGMGRIGQAIAQRATGFGMPILYHNRARLPASALGGLAAQWRPLTDLLTQSDIVILQAPLTPETRLMIGAEALQRMKPNAIIVNGGRGGVIDEDALVDSLTAGTIAGAGLDVFEGEPAINPRLLTCPNLVMTPHLGTATMQTRQAMMQEALANLGKLLGQPITG